MFCVCVSFFLCVCVTPCNDNNNKSMNDQFVDRANDKTRFAGAVWSLRGRDCMVIVVQLRGAPAQPMFFFSSQCRRRLRRQCRILYECPTLECLHYEILVGCQLLVAVCAARLRPPLIKVAVQPQSEFTTANYTTFQLVPFQSLFF